MSDSEYIPEIEVGDVVRVLGREFVLLSAEVWNDRPSRLLFVEKEYRRLDHSSGISDDARKIIKEIRELEESRILGPEQCPEQQFWWWPVLKPDELPEKFRDCHNRRGEIHWYGGTDRVG